MGNEIILYISNPSIFEKCLKYGMKSKKAPFSTIFNTTHGNNILFRNTITKCPSYKETLHVAASSFFYLSAT